jgi:hypothetical protein
VTARGNPAVVLGGALGAAVALLYLSNPGRSVQTATADLEALVTGSIRLSAAQTAIADLILEEFEAAGVGWLALAGVANAYAESRLDPLAVGDGGRAVGLFQVHPWGGTEDERKDPRFNCRAILSDYGLATVKALRGSRTNAELASDFAQYLERCAACGPGGSELTHRADLVVKLYGATLAGTVP